MQALRLKLTDNLTVATGIIFMNSNELYMGVAAIRYDRRRAIQQHAFNYLKI
jgi:hypothetical protein